MANTDVKSGSKKRRRTGTTPAVGLADFPEETLANVSSYLAEPSRLLLAAALTTAPSPPWAAGFRTNLISSLGRWEVLDFADFGKNLAKRMTDNDLASILTVTDAANIVKTLKLTGCVKIVGHGLDPLRGSTALKQIDLSLVGQRGKPSHIFFPSLSEAAVVPILDSLVSDRGRGLRNIQFPYKWRNRNILSRSMCRLLRKCNANFQHLLRCSRCRRDIGGNVWHANNGLQHRSCYQCTKLLCSEGDGAFEPCSNFCSYCERGYCSQCVPSQCCWFCQKSCCRYCCRREFGREHIPRCSFCGANTCGKCMASCEGCDKIWCEPCSTHGFFRFQKFCGSGFLKCDGCTKMLCTKCAEDDSSVRHCDVCFSTYCFVCRVGDCKIDGKGDC